MEGLGVEPHESNFNVGLTKGCRGQHEQVVCLQPHKRPIKREMDLGELDKVQPKMWMQTLYAFENKEHEVGFMNEGKLVWALTRALSHVPILTGNLEGSKVKLPGKGGWFCSQIAKTSFQAAKNDNFNYEVMGSEHIFRKATACMLDEPESAPLFAAKATYFDCGSLLLAVSVSRIVADIYSVYEFMKLWAGGDGTLVDSRQLLKPAAPPLQQPIKPEIGIVVPIGESRSKVRLVNISINHAKLKKAKNTANYALGENWISTKDMICAGIWRALTRARKLPKDATTRMRRPVNIRPTLKLSPSTFANLTLNVTTEPMSVEHFLNKPIHEIALSIRTAAATLSPECIRNHIATVPCRNTPPAHSFQFRKDMDVSDYSHFNLNLIDFQHSPSLICHSGFVAEGLLVIYPGYCHLGISQRDCPTFLEDHELDKLGLIASVAQGYFATSSL
ncbi:hypothetical protein DSO57_1029878 [Entomophthora muscae]|uniref:Uncharacterized protein n=1 Tax=Entomophthora muscae TaxID=34485 RepID=A0ACC2SQC7_9FUNG|nr:hypothetical protein DSO57_1029878 [Entomophthora muscae]